MLFSPIRAEYAVDRASLNKFSALFGLMLRIFDVAVVIVVGVMAYWLRFDTVDMPLEFRQAVARGVLFTLMSMGTFSMYRSWRGMGVVGEAFKLTGVWTTVFVLGVLYVALLKVQGVTSRLWWGYWFVGTVFLSGAGRLVCRQAAAWVRERGLDVRTAVVIGSNADAAHIVRTLERQRWAGIEVRGWFSTADGLQPALAGVPHLGDLAALAPYIESHHISQVWIALPVSEQAAIDRIVTDLDHSTADIKFVPDLFGLQLLNHSVEQIAGLPVINLRASPLDGEARMVKGLEDRVLGALILVLIAPLLALIAIGVKLSSPGPVLFKQKRHGLDGKTIKVWKFRSMRLHDEHAGQVTQATKRDPRITAFGRFLRRTSLDELPQFINVLQGKMSIVGPRPHAVEHNHHYKVIVQNYMQRHRVKPGITGWAQVNGLRGETDTVDKMAARVEYDLHYMQNWSLWLDLRIIAITVVKGFIGKAAY
ncbi:undecaprenyl-phosphate glucose phosphotransferase [Lysobacter sp. S4-A87]|uniref:undecaprenyl-phosphate glucose phosphotransferase n=1 Tax=Lysobacter sp. S4-A87 TaxID=2925843 RepID=UPI001F53DEAB|nr:undecaprenyl-phosphate glucose phosphotransferase [Lysobacter sp. S4-A87]UNK49661.1 undecaprenyl-phosphate glucose phosphotransferase [Lysobacter sp. S4-A87]